MSEAVRMQVENPMAEKDAPSDEDGASDGAGGSPTKAARPPPLSTRAGRHARLPSCIFI